MNVPKIQLSNQGMQVIQILTVRKYSGSARSTPQISSVGWIGNIGTDYIDRLKLLVYGSKGCTQMRSRPSSTKS